MENVWEKLKSLKGRSWNETKDILNKLTKDIHPVEEIVKTYTVNSETLNEHDREIYGVFPKEEPFYLERCKICSHLLKPSVLNYHFDVQHKRSPNNSAKKSLFISPNKKRNGKKGSKSTSEDDSESIVSSETPSPAVDLQETQSSDSNVGLIRDDSIVDVISVDEFASEESKPPTPGPQDLYEEFAVPYTEEAQVLPSLLEKNENTKSIYTTSKSGLRMKITSNKDPNSKIPSTTSLLEAHLLSNTKYSTAAHSNNDSKYRNGNYKYSGDQGTEKSEEAGELADSWKAPFNQSQNTGGAKLKTETKISIPISVLPQNVKIISSLKKVNGGKSTQLLKLSSQKPISTSDTKEKVNNQPSSPYSLEINDNAVPPLDSCKEKSRSKRNKRSKGKNRSTKNVDFDPDKHCGVLIDENRHCLRSLTCKTHAIALRRGVEGRSKEFDKLLAEHRASKEALREQERNQTLLQEHNQNLLLPEPTVSIPLLSVDKISGNTIQIPSANNEPEIVKIRVPNIITNPEMMRSDAKFETSENENQALKKETTEKPSKKVTCSVKPPSVLNVKPTNPVSKVAQSTVSPTKSELKPQLYENDVKISFVCSDMLYKVGGLLYTDRSRQAIRKCMESLISQKSKSLPKRGTVKPKITDFLQLVKNYNNPPVRLSLFKEKNSENVPELTKQENISRPKNEVKLKTNEELERMRSVLAHSSQILKNLSSDENELNKLKISRKLKRKSERIKMECSKKIKLESLSDENYDINTLLSFDKPLTNKDGVDEMPHFPVITTSDGYTFNTIQSNPTLYEAPIKNENQPNDGLSNISNMMGNISYNVYLNNENATNASGYTESDTAQLLQTFKDLENEICNTVGNNMQELYPAQSLQNNSNNVYVNYIANPSDEVGTANGLEFKENCENEFKVIDTNITTLEETISKNYSLIEEYCKNISTEELLLDNKTDFEFYDSGGSINSVKLNKNEVIVVNDNMFVHDRQTDGSVPGTAVDSLTFDTQLLSSYLSSISNESNNANGTDMNFGAGQQYDMAPMDSHDQSMSKQHVYEEILTLNKQFQDNAAVNIEKPSTPHPVYTEAETDRSFKWLF